MVKCKAAFLTALFLVSTIALTLVAMPVANAHTPPWIKPSWTYCVASPNPVGVGQQITIVFWLDALPLTATGDYGDRYKFTLEVTKPDGSNESLGTFNSDPVGGAYDTYTPTEVGNYTFVAKFLGHTFTGKPEPPWGLPATYIVYINDTFLPSTSKPATLTVQQEQVGLLPSTPLPSDYWTRPIDAYNVEWYQVAGNWLGRGNPRNNFNQYSTAPDTSHIVWTRPLTSGGIAGGDLGDASYYTGSSYESKFPNAFILQGRLYYNEYPSIRYRMDRPPPGMYCVDLRTGQTVWWKNDTINFGQIYYYNSPNQHGTGAYLWKIGDLYKDPVNSTRSSGDPTRWWSSGPSDSTSWYMSDPFNGADLVKLINVPSGTDAFSDDGSLLRYQLNTGSHWLALWNSSAALMEPSILAALDLQGNYYWCWRPGYKTTIDARNTGYSWNVSIPASLTGSISSVLSDRIIGTTGFQSYGMNGYSIWCLSIKPENRGTLLWQKSYSAPPVVNTTLSMGPIDEENGIFTVRMKETMQWYGYDLDTGNLVWGPTEAQPEYDVYGTSTAVAYGKLFSAGWSGIVYAFDIETGDLAWVSPTNPVGLNGPYNYMPIGAGAGISVADEKVYVTTYEHSTTVPLYRTWSMYCFDAETGANKWNITGLMSLPLVADGYIVTLNGMDNQIYCFGKGPTSTAVSASPQVTVYGSRVLIEGTVNDVSAGTQESDLTARFPNGVPAIADEYMTQWMEYLYMQHVKPTDTVGVEVRLSVLDSNNNYYEIGKATSDANGFYSFDYKPEIPGKYVVTAEFIGSEAYWSSSAETAFVVMEASQTTTQPTLVPASMADMYFLPAVVAIIVAIVIVGTLILLALRKRP